MLTNRIMVLFGISQHVNSTKQQNCGGHNVTFSNPEICDYRKLKKLTNSIMVLVGRVNSTKQQNCDGHNVKFSKFLQNSAES